MFYSETSNVTQDLSRRPWSEGDTTDLEAQQALSSLGPQRVDFEDPARTSATAPSTQIQFTDYLGILEEDMDLPDPGLFHGLLGSLKRALVREMRCRALLQAPPRYLGIVGGSWDERESMEELLLDCYEFVFVRRLAGLKKQLMARPNVDGLVIRAIRTFLHETQKRHDPLGFRVFQMAQAAVKKLLDSERLHRLRGDARIRCDTVLAFAPWSAPDTCPQVDLTSQVESWNAWLVHDLIAAHHRGPVVERLAEAVVSLAHDGVEIFCFRDLVEPLKADVRSRWQALAPPLAMGQNPTLDAMMLPGADFEARQQLQSLLRCTSQGLDHLEVRKRTRDYLRRLWLFLRNWAMEIDDSETTTDRPPSDSRLGELLNIPRARLPKLRELLGQVVNACRRGILSTKASSSGHLEGNGTPTHRLDERRNALREKTATATTSWARSLRLQTEGKKSAAPQPGDCYVFRQPERMPVEWLILGTANEQGTEQNAERGARFWSRSSPKKDHLFTVPLDDNPFRGSADLELNTGEATHLRSACKAWISPKMFVDGVFTGRLEDEQLGWARQMLEQMPRASSEQQEVDADPEYQAWLRALCADAARLGQEPATGAKILRPGAFQKHRRPIRWLAMAAGLFAALGLSVLWRFEPAEAPLLVPLSTAHGVTVGDITRGVDDSILEVVQGKELVVNIGLWRIDPQPWYRMEIRSQDGTLIWRSEQVPAQDEFLLVLPEGWLPDGYYRLRIYGIGKDGVERPLKENSSNPGSW